jgi:nitroreductase
MHDALTVILNRTSVRDYIDKPLENGILEKLLRAGMAAPSASDKRPWAFIVTDDRDQLNKLAESHPYAKMLTKASIAIVVCGIPHESMIGLASQYWIQDCSAATQNILLAAHALDLGSVWIGVHPIPERVAFVRSVFNIPEDVIPLNVISIGYPKEQPRPKNKFDMNKIHDGKW